MKNLLLFAAFLLVSWTPLLAEEAEQENEKEMSGETTHSMESAPKDDFWSKSYLVVKALSIQSGSYEHAGTTINGASGSGFGFDFGYQITAHFAVELAYNSGSNSLSEHELTGEGKYTSTGVMGTYLYHLNEAFAFLGKLGYASEAETLTIDSVSSSATNGGAVIVVGGEYKLFGHNDLLVEYEKAFIDGPKGANISLGWKVGFGH